MLMMRNIPATDFDAKKVKYPRLDRIIRVQPYPEVLIDKLIYWQEKRCGSNIGIRLVSDDRLEIRTRKQESAHPDFVEAFNRTGRVDNIRAMMKSFPKPHEVVVFAELLREGRSPSRVELHERDDCVVFDIFTREEGFLEYPRVVCKCNVFGIPVVRCYAETRHTSLSEILEFRDRMVALAEENGREGVVGKTWFDGQCIFFKEKIDMPKLERESKPPSEWSFLPVLPDSEVMGAIEKVRESIGDEQFNDKTIAMPLIAKYVKEECEKHKYRAPKKLFRYYIERLEDIKISKER